MFGVPAGELGVLALAIAGGGVLTGVLAGMFGIGGGAIICMSVAGEADPA